MRTQTHERIGYHGRPLCLSVRRECPRAQSVHYWRGTPLPSGLIFKVRLTRFLHVGNVLTRPRSLALFVVLIGLYAVQVVYLMALNKKHGKTRVSLGKQAVLVDKSMNRVEAAEATADGEPEDSAVGQNAFADKTDLENEDFIFVY